MGKAVNWTGVFPAVTTQFNADSSLNLKATQSSIEHLLKTGVNGLIMLGTCGENWRGCRKRSSHAMTVSRAPRSRRPWMAWSTA